MGDINNKIKDLVETVGNGLYRKVFHDEVDLECFTYDEAVTFFIKEKMKTQGAEKCMIAINRENELKNNNCEKLPQNNRFVVRQILLDKNENPIYKTQNSYVGRILTVSTFDQELIEYMNGENKKIMK